MCKRKDRTFPPYWLLVTTFAVMQIAMATASATQFHVRTVAECPYNGDGSSAECASDSGAEGAFSGFQAIDWTAVLPGDTLFIIGRHSDGLVVNKSGTATRQITFRGDKPGFDAGSIDGAGVVSVCVYDNNNRYLSFLNLEIYNCLNRGLQFNNDYTQGVNPSGVIIDNVFLHDIGGGSRWPTCIWGYGHGVLIQNSRIENCADDAVWWTGNDVQVIGNSIAAVGTGPDETGDCVQLAGWSTRFLIMNNHCNHTAANEKHCFIVVSPDASAYDQTAAGQVIDNTCIMPPYDGHDTKGIAIDEPNVLIARNFVTGGRYGIFTTDAYIVANVVTQFFSRGINVTTTPGLAAMGWTTLVVNNTVLAVIDANQPAMPDYCIYGYNTNGEFTNNIASGCIAGMGSYGSNPNNAWIHNLGWQNVRNYEFGQLGVNTKIDPVSSDPYFIGGDPSDPAASSVVLATPGQELSGDTVPGYGPAPLTLDFNETPRPTPPNVGAYEPGSN